MSTRSYFGIMEADEKITLFYCHHDGYLTGVGAHLLEHATTTEAVRQLMADGSRTDIETPRREQTHWQDDFAPCFIGDLQKLSDHLHWCTDCDFCYIWQTTENRWIYTARAHNEEQRIGQPSWLWHDFLPLAKFFENAPHLTIYPLIRSTHDMLSLCSDNWHKVYAEKFIQLRAYATVTRAILDIDEQAQKLDSYGPRKECLYFETMTARAILEKRQEMIACEIREDTTAGPIFDLTAEQLSVLDMPHYTPRNSVY